MRPIECAQKNLFDVIILDTAGRQVVDQNLMKELIEIEKSFKPQETLLSCRCSHWTRCCKCSKKL